MDGKTGTPGTRYFLIRTLGPGPLRPGTQSPRSGKDEVWPFPSPDQTYWSGVPWAAAPFPWQGVGLGTDISTGPLRHGKLAYATVEISKPCEWRAQAPSHAARNYRAACAGDAPSL